MGTDKALLKIGGVPMVQIAVEKLQTFCTHVSIAGNRDDLAAIAKVVHETRVDAGPAAGIEAGLRAAREPWVMFIPVDVPLIPADLLERWCKEALRVNMTVSFLGISRKQPAFCLVRRERLMAYTRLLDQGERRLEPLLFGSAQVDRVACWMYELSKLYAATEYPDERMLERWFMNVNTPEDLAEAVRRVDGLDSGDSPRGAGMRHARGNR